MRHPGRAIFKGARYQTLAGMSLFLQFQRLSNFSYIHFEAPHTRDFDLVFVDNHKIICEARDWSDGLRDSNIASIVEKLGKEQAVGKEDEILIVCSKYKTDIFDLAKNLKFSPEAFEEQIIKRGYRKDQISLLLKLRVWQQTKDDLTDSVYALFSELIGFWLPDKDIKTIAHSKLLEKFYEGSAEGKIYARAELVSEIKSLALDE